MYKESSVELWTRITLIAILSLCVASGFSCLKDVHPGNCTCYPFGRTRVRVKCTGITQVPSNLPENTVSLDLSNNRLKSIPEDAFSNLKFLAKIDLSQNKLRTIPKNTFRNLTALFNVNIYQNNIKGGFFLPKSVVALRMQYNDLTLDDMKEILQNSKDITFLNISGNPLGPNLTADIFAGFDRIVYLELSESSLKRIESGAFQAMKKIEKLYIRSTNLTKIADGAFNSLSKLIELRLDGNKLTSVPDLTGLKTVEFLNLGNNRISNISSLATSRINYVREMSLTKNQIEQLPAEVFQNLNVLYALDLSFNNKLSSIPDRAFSGLKQLEVLFLHFNNISKISSLTFAGLQNLRLLMLVNNSLASLPEKALAEMSLNFLFLHGNRIKNVDANAFRGLTDLRLVTLFKNPALTSLPRNVFDGLNENVTLALSCKTLKWLPRGINEATVVCAPTESLFVVVYSPERRYQVDGLLASGFMCSKCSQGGYRRCLNCSLCSTGTYSSCDRANTHCLRCPAGGFYQDEMGQIDCKDCSIGTYVPEINYPGKSATDCRACPYGTQSDKPAGYRACSCLPHFFRLDRFGPCSACEEHGMVCQSDTAILAPKYFWKFNSSEQMNHYKEFVLNIQIFNAGYNRDFSNYRALLPTPIKCPFTDSCNGGIESSCTEGYEGTLCATCTSNHFLRFNRCLECPSMLVTVISCVLVIVVFIILFLLIFWGDSNAANGERGGTAADVVMSCVKIVVGFYQVASGIFSALRQVQWPVVLVSMEKYLKFIEGNILQFAPLSCIDPVFRLDPFMQFCLSISINISVVLLILIYLLLKRQYIKKLEISDRQKKDEISHLKKSCYRNIFLFLLLSYPITSKKIINVILPLPGVCEDVCFTKDGSDCISLLKADYSISCLSPANGVYWKLAAACAIYPLLFPLLLLIPLYKYREPRLDSEICFGLKVFLENYKEKYWFWEIIEMYRKLILISGILLFDSTSQIVCTVIVASGSGIAYSMARPIKGKFEDRLQAFGLWTVFFNVCLGAITICQNPIENESMFVNIIFVLLNSAVVLIAMVEGLLYLKSNWRNFSSCPVRCFRMMYGRCRDGHRNRRSDLSLIQPLTEERLVFDE